MNSDFFTLSIAERAPSLPHQCAPRRSRLWLFLLLIAVCLAGGYFLLSGAHYHVFSMFLALLACLPFFLSAERKAMGAKEISVLAVLISLCVLSRVVFAILPAFKPVTAIIILCGIAYGAQVGFLVGSMSALVSNLFFGQGPWTPFQMLAWGLIGLTAGLLFAEKKKPSTPLLLLLGAFGGIFYSLLLDVYSVFQLDGVWSFSRYLFLIGSALPFTILYALSNVVFLLLLCDPLLRAMGRIRQKYGVFSQ